jgi:predicted dienelactone hydrolase
MRLLRLSLFAAFWLAAPFAQAAGFHVIAIPADREGPALQGIVWTPCSMPNSDIKFGPYVIPGVRDCPITTAQLPLIVISHGYGGSFLGHHDLAEALADAGFVVAAINHSGDNYRLRDGSSDSISALATRTTDIQRLVNFMLQQWVSRGRLAAGQVGFFGFSRGGYTGLVLAGARPDFKRLPMLPSSPCVTAPESAACARLRQGFRELLALPLARDTRIKAAVIADPFSVVFDADRLKDVTIPIQLWASEYGGDGVTPDSVATLRRSLPNPPDWHAVENAAHFAFLAPCSPAQLDASPEICRDGKGFDRVAFHADFDAKVLAFFLQHLSTPAAAP